MIYTITFNPALDYVIGLDALRTGMINRTVSETVFCGGKGINVSMVLKNLGADVMVLGFTAGFTGDVIESTMKQMGIHSDFIRLQSGMTRINVKIKADTETEINGQGPVISAEEVRQIIMKTDNIKDGDILVLSGSIPASVPEDIYEKIMIRLSSKDIKVIVDAEKDLLFNTVKHRPFLIKPNLCELETLFDVLIKTEDQINYYAKELQKRGVRNVLVSMAEKGAILLDENGTFHKMNAPGGTVKNSVGAGDSMLAGFIAEYLKTQDYAAALKMSVAAGSAAAFSEGLCEKEAVEKVFNML